MTNLIIFKVNDVVYKKSGKPFKNGEKYQTISELGVNKTDPNERVCAIFSDESVCNLDMLTHNIE